MAAVELAQHRRPKPGRPEQVLPQGVGRLVSEVLDAMGAVMITRFLSSTPSFSPSTLTGSAAADASGPALRLVLVAAVLVLLVVALGKVARAMAALVTALASLGTVVVLVVVCIVVLVLALAPAGL
jgi:hypothetical protein